MCRHLETLKERMSRELCKKNILFDDESVIIRDDLFNILEKYLEKYKESTINGLWKETNIGIYKECCKGYEYYYSDDEIFYEFEPFCASSDISHIIPDVNIQIEDIIHDIIDDLIDNFIEEDRKEYFHKKQRKVMHVSNYNYLKLSQQYKISINEKSKYLLEQLTKKEGSISSIRLHSLSRIKKTNFNITIFNLNTIFRKIYKKEFLLFENVFWEVNPFFNHPGNWEHKDKTIDYRIKEIKPEKKLEEEYPKWVLEQTKKLEDIFKHTATSYKFYWFKALLTLVERGMKEASFKQMAALMVAHAWKDVLIENCKYTKIDQIPNVVRRIYLDSHLQHSENENSIIEYLFDNLEKYDDLFLKLLIIVPYRFLSTFIENLKGLKDSQKNDFIESKSKTMSLIYKIEKCRILINADWHQFILDNFDDFKKLIKNSKKCEES